MAVASPLSALAPFDSLAAKKHADAWAEYLNVPVEYSNSLGMSFRLIPPGEFMMGSAESTIQDAVARHEVEYWRSAIRSEGPQHRVVLTKPIYMGAHEVTFGAFGQFVHSPQPVGQKKPNALGLYDTLGNVWEWVEDRYAADSYASANVVNPRGVTASQERVKRGGDIGNTPRATDRGPQHADVPYMFDGFRVALSVEAVRGELKRVGPPIPPSAEEADER